MDEASAPTMFRPFLQLSDAPMTLLIRTKRDPLSVVPDVRRVMAGIDHDAALECLPLRRAMADSIVSQRAGFITVSSFALAALITAAFGLYGLVTYRVNQQQQELGIRLALGASAGSILWIVQKRCLTLICLGSAAGLPAAFALARLMTSLLYNTQPTDASAYLAVFLVFVMVGLAASFGPALRASRLDPAAAIRHE